MRWERAGREVQEGGDICTHTAESLLCTEGTKATLYNYIIIEPLFVSVCVSSVMSNSLQPHGLQPTRLLCPWNFPGKITGVGCHFLLQGLFLTQGLNLILLRLL